MEEEAMLWNDFCFALDCFRVSLAIFTVISGFLALHFILKPLWGRFWFWFTYDLDPFLIYCQIALVLFGAALAIGSIILTIWIWPSYTSKAIVTVWALIIAYALWKLALEPFCFRISQEFSRMTGCDLSDYATAILVPCQWVRLSIRHRLSYRSAGPIRTMKDDERDPNMF